MLKHPPPPSARACSDVTYMMKESLSGDTDGIKKVQSLFSVIDRNTLSVLLLSQVNTPVMDQTQKDHANQVIRLVRVRLHAAPKISAAS